MPPILQTGAGHLHHFPHGVVGHRQSGRNILDDGHHQFYRVHRGSRHHSEPLRQLVAGRSRFECQSGRCVNYLGALHSA